jgi:DNA-binding MarR family transcriptional regulator
MTPKHTPTERLILREVSAQGTCTIGQLIDSTECNPYYSHQVVAKLVKSGHLTQNGPRYSIPTDATSSDTTAA